MELAVGDTRYISVPFGTDAEFPLDLDAEFGFTEDEEYAPTSTFAATIAALPADEVTDEFSYEATLLVGPNTPHVFERGVCAVVWFKITDNPEVPLSPVGVILPY